MRRLAIQSWRESVAALARQRATEESLQLWNQPPDESPRFNYRWEHIQAVVKQCEKLGRQLGADLEVLEAAAWLHDIVKSHSIQTAAIPDATLAAEEARRCLRSTDFPPSKIDRVYEAIRTHEGLFRDHPLEQLEAAVLWDADKLSKLGALYLVHNLCISPVFAPLFEGRPPDTDLVLASTERWLTLAERIVASMNTEPGRAEAARRLVYLRDFVQELKDEWKESPSWSAS